MRTRTWVLVALTVAAAGFLLGAGRVVGADAKRKIAPVTIHKLPYSIDAPGTYVLNGDLLGSAGNDGITVRSADVRIDLRGFRLIGAPGSGAGIFVTKLPVAVDPEVSAPEIVNGAVLRWGASGIDAAAAAGCRFRNLRVDGNAGTGLVAGARSEIGDCWLFCNGIDGLQAGDRCVLRNCAFRDNKSNGAVVGNDATIEKCGFTCCLVDGLAAGDRCVLRQCIFQENKGSGAVVGDDATIGDCWFFCDLIDGIVAGKGSLLAGCVVRANGRNGVTVGDRSDVRDCRIDCNGVIGALVGSNSQVDGNSFSGNDTLGLGGAGLRVTGTGNSILRNTARGQSTAFDLYVPDPKENVVAPIGRADAATSPFANVEN